MKHRSTVIVQKSERGLHKTVREQYPELVGVLPDYPKRWIGILKTPDTYLDFRRTNSEESHTTRGGGATRPPLHLRAPKKDEHITVERPSRKCHRHHAPFAERS
jgi:hypothetical protein